MLRSARKYISICLLFLTLVQLVPFVTVSADSQASYGEAYNDLTTDAQRTAYRLIEEGIAGLAPVISIEGIVDIYYRDLSDIIRAVCVDHPQYFWFLETGMYHYDHVFEGNLVTSFEPEYILDEQTVSAGSQTLADAMYAFNAKVNEIIDGIPVNYTTEYDIALYLHDYMAEHVTYTLEGDHPSAYAALIHGQAACYGYSKAYQCLLNAAGIRARTITGNCDDGNGNLEGHAWNQVWLDGQCYYVDVTWDDYDAVNLHACFALSLEEISQDHYADPEFILPECGHTGMDYHTIRQGTGVAKMNSRTSAADAAASFSLESWDEDGAVFGCEIRFVGGQIFTWLDSIRRSLLNRLGLSLATEIYYYSMYDVYYLQLLDPKYQYKEPVIHSITLNLQSITLPGEGTQAQLVPQVQSDSIWTPVLIYTCSDETVARVDENGLITAVSEGIAVITARSENGGVSAVCTVTVTEKAEHIHSMRQFSSAAATCTQDGHETYYLCTLCGRRFADEDGINEYTQTSAFILPATGHLDTTWMNRLEYHIQRCRCGEELSDTKQPHSDADKDGRCDSCNCPMPSVSQKKPATSADNDSDGWALPAAIAIVIVAGVAIFFLIRRCRRGY